MLPQATFADQVVVGVDGSPSAAHAAEWAAVWAARTGRDLGLVAALGVMPRDRPDGQAIATVMYDAFRNSVADMLAQTAGELRNRHPGLTVNTTVVWGDAAIVLVEVSQHAEVLVLGTRGLGGWQGLLMGGVADKVATHARGPLVVVPPNVPLSGDGPVVLGVDDPETGSPRITFAVQAAQVLGKPLVMIHAWQPPDMWRAIRRVSGSGEWATIEADAQDRINRATEKVRALDADLELLPRVVSANPVATLADASGSAELVVLGSRGRGGWQGLLLGSTSREMIQRTHCPLAIIRARPAPGQDKPAPL
ncbi:MAG TPA: universal stress protein [Dermatophilaceae bacterium]|nr:universal stress protein [Dermatophilaceae bacterium]